MKRNYFQRMIIFILVAVFATVALSSCGSNTEPSGDAVDNSSGTSNDSSGTSNDATKIHKLKIMGPESDNTHVKFADREKYLAWQELDKWFKEAGLDIEFEVIDRDQYDVTIQTRIASATDLPDFCNIEPLDIAACLNLAEKKMILPINEIIEKYGDGTAKEFFENKADFARKVTTAPDGNRYWISNVQATTYEGKPASTCKLVAIRDDWLQKLGLPVPTTLEEFVSTLKAFQEKDANGNGVKDEIYATNTPEFDSGISQWFGLPNARIAVDANTGKVVSPWYMDGVKEYFAFMNRLIKEGLLDETLIGASGSVLNQMIAENKVGALCTYTLQTYLEPSIVGVEDALYRPLEPIAAVEGIIPIISTEPSELAWGRWAVMSECEDLEGMAKFLDIICSERFATLSAWGIEGVTFEIKDNIETFIINQSDWEESARTGNCPGEQLWGRAMFPKMRFAPMESEINSVQEVKRQVQKNVIFYTPAIPNNNETYMAVPTKEEQIRLAELETNFKTFSKELATDLMLGNRSLDDWDTHIQQLKEAGLDEIMEIYQARFDRFSKS